MKTSRGKFLNLAHYFPYDVKLRLLAHSLSFLANQKARNAIVGAENLLNTVILMVTDLFTDRRAILNAIVSNSYYGMLLWGQLVCICPMSIS